MKPFSEPKQDWFLYNGIWNIARDSYLIKRLVEREEECKPILPADSPHAIICATEALIKEAGADVTSREVMDRVNHFRKRYNCFRKLASRVDTNWDVSNNLVTADESVWKIIFEEDDFTQAYYKQGDPIWSQLCRLFGYNAIKKEASRTVVVLSDSPHGVAAPSTNICIFSSEDEVTSPVMKAPIARKLTFDNEAESSIGPLPAKVPHVYHVCPPIEPRFRFPPANAFPVKPKELAGKWEAT